MLSEVVALEDDSGAESGDWFIRARRSAIEEGGVLNAPVDSRWSFSNSSCSSFGSLGGAGPCDQALPMCEVLVNVRMYDGRATARIMRSLCIVCCGRCIVIAGAEAKFEMDLDG